MNSLCSSRCWDWTRLEVLEAAGTKWNFHRLSGRAWSADTASVSIPYYLTHKAQSVGFHTGNDLGRAQDQRWHGAVRRPRRDQADSAPHSFGSMARAFWFSASPSRKTARTRATPRSLISLPNSGISQTRSRSTTPSPTRKRRRRNTASRSAPPAPTAHSPRLSWRSSTRKSWPWASRICARAWRRAASSMM